MHCALICLYWVFIRTHTLVNVRIQKEKPNIDFEAYHWETKGLNNFLVTFSMSRFKKEENKGHFDNLTWLNYLAEPRVYEHVYEYFSMIDKKDNPQIYFEKRVSIFFLALTSRISLFFLLTFCLPCIMLLFIYICVCPFNSCAVCNQVSDLIFFKDLISDTLSSQQAIFM